MISNQKSIEEGETKRYIRHMALNIEGCLRNYKGKKITFFDDDNGNRVGDGEARKYLAECLAKGWKLIPMGDCPTFDHQTGCPGHEITDTQQTPKTD